MLHVELDVDDSLALSGMSLLEATESRGKLLQSGCRAGACGRCVVELESGLDALTQAGSREQKCLEVMGLESVGRYRLACQARIKNRSKILFLQGESK